MSAASSPGRFFWNLFELCFLWLSDRDPCRPTDIMCKNGACVDSSIRCQYGFDKYGYPIGCPDATHLERCGKMCKNLILFFFLKIRQCVTFLNAFVNGNDTKTVYGYLTNNHS